jgi:anaerobic dimethyl sulfoxide reductase subunit B (iron-sulfur subunit)
MSHQLAFSFDSSLCIGCKTCQIACRDKHDLNKELEWRRVYEITGGGWIKKGNTWIHHVVSYYLSIACNHCKKPICLEVCPSKALSKRQDGIVFLDRKKCIGCRYCEWACPYGAPQFDKVSGTMSKCHLCYDYIEKSKVPVCVTSCPMRALDFGEISKLKNKYKGNAHIYPLPDPSLTEPNIIIKPHRDEKRARNEKAKCLLRGEEMNAWK